MAQDFTWTSVFTNQDLDRDNFILNLRTRIDEDTADIITDVQIIALITAGLRDINFRTRLLPEYATASLDGSASYTLPTDMAVMYEVLHKSADSTPVYKLLKSSNLDQIDEEGYDTGTAEFYVRNGNSIELFGSAPTTGSLRIYGARVPTAPATGGSYIDLPVQYHELLYYFCEWKYWTRRRKPEEAALARDLYLTMATQVAEEVQDNFSRGVTAYGAAA